MNFSSKGFGAMALLLSGCSQFQPTQEITSEQSVEPHPVLSSLAEVRCSPISITGDQLQLSARIENKTPFIQLDSGTTPFLAYHLPANTQEIKIESYPLNSSNHDKAEIFFPEIALLDHNNQVLRIINNIKYQKRGLLSSESLTASTKLNHIEDRHAACLIIYTTDKLKSEKTVLNNQAKEYAWVRGSTPLPIPDVSARHGNAGELSIIFRKGETPSLATVALTPAPQPAPDSFSNAMKSHYLDGTRTAIAEKDVKKALALRNEFTQVLQATEGYFVSQFGRDKDRVIEPSAPYEEEGFAGKAIYHYQSEIFRYLKTGQASSALKLQDSLKHMQRQLDAMFDSK